jgi:thiosulfate reductase cytochrome b subunit
MATFSTSLRRGLPRVVGGSPWPPNNEVPARVSEMVTSSGAPSAAFASAPHAEVRVAVTPEYTGAPPEQAVAVSSASSIPQKRSAFGQVAEQEVFLRRGLPRVPGGQPWPHVESAPATPSAETSTVQPIAQEPAGAADVEATTPAPLTLSGAAHGEGRPLRRGLPRVPGGKPWPSAGFAPVRETQDEVQRAVQTEAPIATAAERDRTAPSATPLSPVVERLTPSGDAVATRAAQSTTAAATPAPATVATTAQPPRAAASKASTASPKTGSKQAKPKRALREFGSRSAAGWFRFGGTIVGGAIVVAAILVLAARGLTTLPGVSEFLQRYPGEYHLPDSARPGFPAWAQWTHFLNFFFMVLIVRTGLQVRRQQKPPAYWTPKRGGKKISINLWLHTSLDILWLVNGLVFVVLLFVSGHWMRIVPTSWEVFPNAASAALQYATLDWPTENGWVNYNSLQQLMYFIVVFIAAPVAAITGVRMSEWWPQNAKRMNKIYPAPLARALHFPTMLFFVVFVIIHVFLVLATGALRNLNHMFAGTDVINWTGFWLFAGSLVLTAAAVVAARPLVIAPIANLFGKVSNR